jgi:hypothetical protein
VTAFNMNDFTLACPRCGKAFAIRNRQAGQRYLCPHCGQPFSLQKAGDAASPPPDSAKPTTPSAPAFIPEDLLAGPTSVRPLRARKSPLRLFGPAGLVVALAGVAVLFYWNRFERGREKVAASNPTGARNRPVEPRDSAHGEPTATDRKPIELLLAPAGARIVIHLRPDRLWATAPANLGATTSRSPGSRASELLLCVSPLAEWARGQIDDWCLYPPSQIAEAVFSFGLRSPGEPPDTCAVVRLTHSAALPEIERRFGGVRSEKGPLPVFLKGDRALIVRDAQTFTVGPAESSHEMVEARDQPNPTDASIEELLKETDRSRDLTIVFRPDDLDRFRESLASPQWSSALHQLATWLDPDSIEGAVFSVRLEDPLRVRLTVRARPIVFGPHLAETMKLRLDRLPMDLLRYVERLQPAIPGSRKLIGRLPAMCKAVALGAAVNSQSKIVTVESILPERAAPNLSLATYLLLTEGPSSMGRSPAARIATKRDGRPKSLAARLQTVVDVDFKRTPLSEAFESIGGDIGVTFELDGGALKLAGYTKNMPQTFQIKGAPAVQSLQTILKAYPKLALVADEARGAIVVTTTEAAAAQHKTPMALGN